MDSIAVALRRRRYLCAATGLSTEDSKRPSMAVTCVTYRAGQPSPPASSTLFHRPVALAQSHSEPGRWQHPPVVMVTVSQTLTAEAELGYEGSRAKDFKEEQTPQFSPGFLQAEKET